MEIEIVRIDSELAHLACEIQHKAYQSLLEKYRDYQQSPACENVDTIRRKIENPATDSYIFTSGGAPVGWVRITDKGEGTYKISALSVLPKYQNKGVAQYVLGRFEEMYPNAVKWIVDTITQEQGNCHIYEKLGYKRVGEPRVVNELMSMTEFEKIMTGTKR